MKGLRFILAATAGLCVAFALLALAAFYALQTSWFKEQVRQRTIAAIERTSGGRVELGSFDYDWRTLTADFRNIVVRGTESSDANPLFRADSIRIGLKMVSLLRRDVNVASLQVIRPRFHVLVRPDGSTNIPSPRSRVRNAAQTIQDLFDLKINHLELNEGIVEAESRRLPFSARGEDVSVVLTYDRRGSRYNLGATSRKLHIEGSRFRAVPLRVDVRAELKRNRLTIQSAVLASAASTLRANGFLKDFANPDIDLRVQGNLSGAEIAAMWHVAGLHQGDFVLNGALRYAASGPLAFEGSLGGHHLEYWSKQFAIRNADFESGISADTQEIKLSRLTLTALGGRFTGAAQLNRSGLFEAAGLLGGVNLSEAARFSLHQLLPWAGVVSGPLEIRGAIADRLENVSLHGKLRITPGLGGIPISGDVELSYAQSRGSWDFAPSHLAFPNTHLSFAGRWGSRLEAALDSTSLEDIKPALLLLHSRLDPANIPILLPNGSAHFDGTFTGSTLNPRIDGNLALARFRLQGQTWNALRSRVSIASDAAQFSSFVADLPSLYLSGEARVGLHDWSLQDDNPLRLRAQFRAADLFKTAAEYSRVSFPPFSGIGSGSIELDGSLADPRGSAQLTLRNVTALGERLDQVQAAVALSADQLQITRGRMQAGSAALSFSGRYTRHPGHIAHHSWMDAWREGDLQLKVDSSRFPLAFLSVVRQQEPGLNAEFEIHAEGAAHITPGHLTPTHADGELIFRRVTVDHVPYGSVTLKAVTHGQMLSATISGDLRASHVSGEAQVQLEPGTPVKGALRIERIDLPTLIALVNPAGGKPLPLTGFVRGGLTFEGSLQQPDRIRGTLRFDDLQLSSSVPVQPAESVKSADLIFRNVSPVVFEMAGGVASVRDFRLVGQNTTVAITGSIPYRPRQPIDLKVKGDVDLRVFQLFDPNVRSSGQSVVSASIGGALSNPDVHGTLELQNGIFFLNDVPNGLTAVNGIVNFDRNRATIQKLTARTGGGELTLGGFVTFGAGPLVYRLEANAQNVRVRYAGSISITTTSQLRLTGTSNNSILSGTATISRVVLNPSADVGNLLASVAAPTPAPSNQDDFLTGLQLDVRVESAANLQFSTTLSRDIQAEIDLRLRGTPDHPILLGSIVANQGDIKVFGTRYSINRGEVNFVNSVKIEPVLDLDLRTEARGITVDITVSGTLGKLNINYRSDPALQPREIIALLTVGRTPDVASNVPNAQVANDVSALQSGANTVLGQAISPASNRLSKLFGITNIKIDPLVQGTTTTPQARLTLEQQISRDITVTYVTNLSQTSEQIFRLEWALSAHYSVVALRNDNGEFGIDLQYRKRFK